MFLDSSLQRLPNDDLLIILEKEQLPKLKALFDMPSQPTMRKKSAPSLSSQQSQLNQSQYQNSIDITPKSNSKQSISLK
jgi:hypothetical protein